MQYANGITSLFDMELSTEEEEIMFLNAGTRPSQLEWCEINRHVAEL